MNPEQEHQRSLRLYPGLNLSDGEYIISAIRRHPIGLVLPLALGTFLIALVLIFLQNYNEIMSRLAIVGPFATVQSVAVPLLVFIVIIILGMVASAYVYSKNRFFLTNESIIQQIQYSLFSHREKTVSLRSIEDASYAQIGILQQLLDYGEIRLSIEGEGDPYRFIYAARPKDQIDRINNAVEAFKNARPGSDS